MGLNRVLFLLLKRGLILLNHYISAGRLREVTDWPDGCGTKQCDCNKSHWWYNEGFKFIIHTYIYIYTYYKKNRNKGRLYVQQHITIGDLKISSRKDYI